SRRRHTRFSRDWSSDVCSSDLNQGYGLQVAQRAGIPSSVIQQAREKLRVLEQDSAGLKQSTTGKQKTAKPQQAELFAEPVDHPRSEERRGGNECAAWWAPSRTT